MAVTLNAKGTSVSSFTIGKGGQAITLNANGYLTIDDGVDTEQPLGYNTIPIYEIDANDTFDLAHAGMMWHKDAGGAVTFTCDNDSTIPQGSTWIVHNDDAEDITIAQGTGVTIAFLASGAAPSTGDVTVSQGGIVTVYKYTDTEYWVWGDDGPFNILTAGSTTDSTLRWNGSAWAENTTVTITSTGVVTAASTAGNHTFSVDSATTNADIPVLKLSATSTGTPAAGIGPSIQFEAETAAANLEIGGEIALEATDVTATTEDFDFVFNLMSAGGAATEVFRISSTGTLTSSSLTDNRVLIAGTGGIIEDDANLTWDGSALSIRTQNQLRLYEGGNTEYARLYATSAATYIERNAISTEIFIVNNHGGGFLVNDNGNSKFFVDIPNSLVQIDDGYALRIEDSTSADYINIAHDGTDVNFGFVGTTDLNLNDGVVFKIWDSTNTDNAAFSHDGTNFATTFTNTTSWDIFGSNVNISQASVQPYADRALTVADSGIVVAEFSRNASSGLIIDINMNNATAATNAMGFRFQQQASLKGFIGWYADPGDVGIGNTYSTSPWYTFGNPTVRGFRIWDTGFTDYAQFDHDGTDFNITGTNTTDINITGADVRIANQLTVAGASKQDNTSDVALTVLNASGTGYESGIFVSDNFAFDSNNSRIAAVVSSSGTAGDNVIFAQSDQDYNVNVQGADGYVFLGTGRAYTNTNQNHLIKARLNVNATVANTATDNTLYQAHMYVQDAGAANTSISQVTGFLSYPQFAVATGAITTMEDFRAGAISGTANGAITTRYGFLVDFDDTSITNPWGFYSSGANVNHFLGGGGELRIADSTNADYVAFSHDGTDFNIVGTTTTDINMTSGITAVNLPQITLTTALDETYGGTGQTTLTTGDLLYASGANTFSKLALGNVGEVLTVVGSNVAWNPPAVIEFAYDSTVTAADPGAGTIRFDSVTIGSIANAYIDDLDASGDNAEWILSNLADGDILTFRSITDSADYIIASVNGTPTDGTGYWTVPLTLIHTGTIFTNGDQMRVSVEWAGSNASVSGFISGTVADNQIVTGTGASTVDSSANLTYNGTTLTMAGAGAQLLLPQENDAATPTLAFGDGDTGFYELSDDTIRVAIGTSALYQIDATHITGTTSASFYLRNTTVTDTNPSLGPRRDTNTGIGSAENDSMSLIAGGVEHMRFDGVTGGQDHIKAEVPFYMDERVAALNDYANYGQLWVRNDAPNTLMYTDDAGNDFTANNVFEIAYVYSSAVTSTDPGAGTLNFNSVTIGSITTVYIDDLDDTGRDNSYMLSTLADGDLLEFRSASDPADYIVATVNGAPTDSTGFWTISLTLVNTGTIFTNNDQIRIIPTFLSQAAGSGGTVTSVDITAGTLIDKTGGPITTSGSITIDVDLSEATEAVYAPATDYLLFLDGGVTGTAAKESGADFAAALAGTGLTASGGVINRDTIALTTDTSGDYVATITGGTGIDSTGATTGEGIAHTLSVDLGEVTAVVFDPAVDFVPIIDGGATGTTQKDAWADIATAIAGTGITATSGVLSADNNGTVTSVDITAGTLIDKTGGPITTSGSITIDVDLSEATEAVYAPATDYLLFLDGGVTGTAAKESGADFATALAGAGLSASSGTLTVDGYSTATVQTTTATQTEILALSVASGTSVGFEALIMGREDATGDTVLEKIRGLISNEAGTTAMIDTPGVDRHESAGAATWTITVAADNATDELTFDVTGEASHTIDWKINLEVIVI